MLRGGLKRWAALLRGELLTVYHAARDPAAPWGPRLLALGLAIYVLSPVDLIPDLIPVLGWLDDLVLLPLGLALVLRLMPAPVRARAQARAAQQRERLPRQLRLAGLIVLLWLAVVLAALYYLWRAAL